MREEIKGNPCNAFGKNQLHWSLDSLSGYAEIGS
jgi:hypothetical protein